MKKKTSSIIGESLELGPLMQHQMNVICVGLLDGTVNAIEKFGVQQFFGKLTGLAWRLIKFFY